MDLILVIDLRTSKEDGGIHFGSLFIEQAPIQAYRVKGLDRNEHGQATEVEKDDYIDTLVNTGFVEIGPEWDDLSLGSDRPEKYFLVLTADRDWDLDEITVMNTFENHAYLMRKIKELNLQKMAHRLLVDDWKITKKWVNARGNLQLNHGANNLDIRDTTKIPGMNTARNHMRPVHMKPGLDGDDNIEDTLLRMQITVTAIFDYIAEHFDKDKVFQCKKRRKYFAGQEMKKRGFHPDAFRADAGAFLFTGLLPERTDGVHSLRCRFHEDTNNDHREANGANEHICINQVVEMHYPHRSQPVLARAAMNQFQKKCNGDVLEKLAKTRELLEAVRKYMARTGYDASEQSNVDWTQISRAVEEAASLDNLDFATLPAHANKDCHYSWYIHVLIEEVLPVYGWDERVLIEAIYLVSLTPSAIGWRTGLRYALLARNNGRNLVVNFIREMMFKHGKVAYHFNKKARHQVASGGIVSNASVFTSLYNLEQLVAAASDPSCVSKRLYEDCGSNEFRRKAGRLKGMRNVKDITAHNIMNLCTKMYLVTNTSHIRSITIAKGTETAKRLKRFGITTDAHLREVVYILSIELGIEDTQIVENLICETLRALEGGGTDRYRGVDTIARNQPLYQVVGEVLWKFAPTGRSTAIGMGELRGTRGCEVYAPECEWWRMEEDNPIGSFGTDFDWALSTESKKLKEYLATLEEEIDWDSLDEGDDEVSCAAL